MRGFLREFLSDPAVVDLPRLPWRLILELVILPRRPARVAAAYRTIWTAGGSPLLRTTLAQARALEAELEDRTGRRVPVAAGMRYGEPSLAAALGLLEREGCRRIVVLPLFPQPSGVTVGSVIRRVRELTADRPGLELRWVEGYAGHDRYIAALAASVRDHWAIRGRSGRLLVSFHGIPTRFVRRGDAYPVWCEETAGRLAGALELGPGDWAMAYQSRFGPGRWLGPDTHELLARWGGEGVESVDVVCPGFPADCLETLEEIGVRARERFVAAGGRELRLVPALGDRPDHVAALADLVLGALGADQNCSV